MRSAGPSRRRRVRAVLLALPVVALLSFLLAPERHLACDETWLKERSPDHAWTLTVCRRPMMFAMPGGGSDAPGWIVLRDADDAIRGVVHLEMMQLLAEAGPAGGTRWQPDRVMLSGLAEMPLVPATSPVSRWFADRLWRVRASAGLVPSDLMSAQ
ncbi:hypothetical protein EKPJFOCH_1705 [Methylobacterium thuringiense]|uniref:Uncharacterized protein n=1 Tax=Methylobacterium thuringiense TaxID=1003091 RepID=A0ABQ4TIW6_9HYPH|nr:hypothetical protein EKPJFOCH_1705 [Methylobacterium thuringiense]